MTLVLFCSQNLSGWSTLEFIPSDANGGDAIAVDGALYGTPKLGGQYNRGTVFKIVP
jgi:uncharacterized repeat protein (TIGR03803 family)